ncbi:hypothetical protein A5747_13655 [Mycobacterium sp. IS-836]|uniref:hypothetical protein n=1 Tax=Mycobacterium sp. IS-836 TaxID=1834160 RepID=UPI00096EE178|nr:hypothetical protein [Mycobacterium sp. IS-836]OMC55429.1 hypothetical protein A5747_13655 [Mycobacterium sp. IS-836]
MIRKALLSAALIAALSACGDHPVPAHGHITDREFTPAGMMWMPGTMTCSGNPPICTTTPGYPIYWPDEWRVEVTDLKNGNWKGTVEVSQDDYDHCPMGALWPDCAREK